MDSHERRQTRDCQESDEIVDACHYQMIVADTLSSELETGEHMRFVTEYVRALPELVLSCRAVVFDNSKKMHTRKSLVGRKNPGLTDFLHWTVNVRIFRGGKTDDFVADSLGMNFLDLPDMQYHFHGTRPDLMVAHARCL